MVLIDSFFNSFLDCVDLERIMELVLIDFFVLRLC